MNDADAWLFVPPWNYPHTTVERPRTFNAVDQRFLAAPHATAHPSLIDSVEDDEFTDPDENNTPRTDVGSIGSSSSAPNDEKVDPFSSLAWRDPKLVRRNNEAAMQFTTQGGISFQHLRMHNAIFAGFGPVLRPGVWAVRLSLDVADRLDLRELVARRGVLYVDYAQIMTDIPRTYSELEEAPPPRLSAVRQPEKIYQLMLGASSFNHSLGYGQGMNRLAIVLVDVFKEPWQQLWALDHILTRIIPHYFTRRHMIGLLVDIALLGFYIRERDPELAAHLISLDDPFVKIGNSVLYTLCSNWWISLFVCCMPYGCVVRLWDSIIMDGAQTLFNFTFRVLELNRVTIMAARDSSELVRTLTQWIAQIETLDVLANFKLENPIELSDVEMRRAAHLHAMLIGRPGTTFHMREIVDGHIEGYTNCGRGCVCESRKLAENRQQSHSRAASQPGVANPFVASIPHGASSADVGIIGKPGAHATNRQNDPMRYYSIDESLFVDARQKISFAPASSFTTDSMPLAAPLRSASTLATRHVRRGTKVVSSNNTIGASAPPAVDVRSNGTTG